jgi:hypothetical protein
MSVPGAKELKVVIKPGITQHSVGIAANGHHFACWEMVVVIKIKTMHPTEYGAFIFHGLSIIFTILFQSFNFKQPIRHGKEVDVS